MKKLVCILLAMALISCFIILGPKFLIKSQANHQAVLFLKQVVANEQKGTTVKSYDDLQVTVKNLMPSASVNLVMYENGKEMICEDVKILFIRSGGKWMVSGIKSDQPISWNGNVTYQAQ